MCSSSCNCMGCANNHENSQHRYEAISQILSRNPDAFNIKYKSTPNNDTIYKKGCNCKKSNCLKKYCECFNAGVPCSEHCKCCECKNNNIASSQVNPSEFKREILSSVMNESAAISNFKKQKIEEKPADRSERERNERIKGYLSPQERYNSTIDQFRLGVSAMEKKLANSAGHAGSWEWLNLLNESGKGGKEVFNANFNVSLNDEKKKFERKLDFALETEKDTN